MTRQPLERTASIPGLRAAWRTLALAICLLASTAAAADDEAALRGLLDEFLSRVDEVAMHERFWDDALIYTSSSGTRFGKVDILAGMQESDAENGGDGDTPPVRYWAEEVRVMLLGDAAVVAFRLMSETGEGAAAERASYFNTGTFRAREDGWRVVAWQATRIPEDA